MNKAYIISSISEIVYFLRIQNYHEGCMRFRKLIQEMQLEADVKAALFDEQSGMKQVLMQMLQALEADDVVLLADLLEEAFLPLVKALVIYEEPFEYGHYQVESTSSEYLTVKHLPSNLYLHSNVNPMEEVRVFVESCFDPTKGRYVVWGCGFGYHILRLYEAARGAIHIEVYDEDELALQLAKESGVLDVIPQKCISLTADSTGEKFVEALETKDVGILLHFPSIKKIQDKRLKDALHAFFAEWNGTIQFKQEFAVNFRNNIQYCTNCVDELENEFQQKEVVLVAAGPSLDHSLEFLKEAKGNKVIVAVSTVLKKLLKLGINPDYVIVMDSQQRTIGHIDGIEGTNIPLIVDTTAYWEFAAKYAGKKYIAYQKGYKSAEELANKFQCKLYETGGSVITLALDIVLKLGAKAVYLIGVDLAYPGGVSHASDTMDKKQRDVSDMEQVKAVHGGMVYADSLFIGYRKWMERKIEEYAKIPIYNLSDCGAEIAGTIGRI